jgi:hypothetical protein
MLKANTSFIVSDSSSLRDYHITNPERFFELHARLGLSDQDLEHWVDAKLNYYPAPATTKSRGFQTYHRTQSGL